MVESAPRQSIVRPDRRGFSPDEIGSQIVQPRSLESCRTDAELFDATTRRACPLDGAYAWSACVVGRMAAAAGFITRACAGRTDRQFACRSAGHATSLPPEHSEVSVGRAESPDQ